jgi:sortase A
VARQRAGFIEIASWVLGLSLLAFVSAALAHRWLGRDDAIDAFREAQRQYQAAPAAVVAQAPGAAPALIRSGGAQAPDFPAAGPSVPEPSDMQGAARPAHPRPGAVAELPVVRAASTAPAGPVVLASTAAADDAHGPLNVGAPVDTRLWSEARIKGYEDSLKASLAAPSALLHIPAIDLTVPVLEGVDEVSLNRGVGRIPGTAPVGAPGNLGIAGHRDGYFRGLKDIGPGTRLELETLSGKQSYTVSDIWIVKPADVHVLEPTATPSITLVTCYPFYFVGHAPERYIVRATMDGASAASP